MPPVLRLVRVHRKHAMPFVNPRLRGTSKFFDFLEHLQDGNFRQHLMRHGIGAASQSTIVTPRPSQYAALAYILRFLNPQHMPVGMRPKQLQQYGDRLGQGVFRAPRTPQNPEFDRGLWLHDRTGLRVPVSNQHQEIVSIGREIGADPRGLSEIQGVTDHALSHYLPELPRRTALALDQHLPSLVREAESAAVPQVKQLTPRPRGFGSIIRPG